MYNYKNRVLAFFQTRPMNFFSGMLSEIFKCVIKPPKLNIFDCTN